MAHRCISQALSQWLCLPIPITFRALMWGTQSYKEPSLPTLADQALWIDHQLPSEEGKTAPNGLLAI